MFCRQRADLFVVGQHAMAGDARIIVAIDHHEAGAVRVQILQHLGVADALRRGEDDAVDLPAVQQLQLRPFFR